MVTVVLTYDYLTLQIESRLGRVDGSYAACVGLNAFSSLRRGNSHRTLILRHVVSAYLRHRRGRDNNSLAMVFMSPSTAVVIVVQGGKEAGMR
jgi:hypothetical protein